MAMQMMQDEQTQGLTPAQQAGQKGGRTTSKRYGPDFYRNIGSRSGGKFVQGGYRAKDSTPTPV